MILIRKSVLPLKDRSPPYFYQTKLKRYRGLRSRSRGNVLLVRGSYLRLGGADKALGLAGMQKRGLTLDEILRVKGGASRRRVELRRNRKKRNIGRLYTLHIGLV